MNIAVSSTSKFGFPLSSKHNPDDQQKPSTEERIAEALSEVNCEKVTECPPEVEVPLQTPTADSPEKEKNLEKTSNSEAAKESNSVEITSEPDDSLPQSDSPSLDYFVPNSQVNDSINP